jgi:hypothetical protein
VYHQRKEAVLAAADRLHDALAAGEPAPFAATLSPILWT